ncbi:alpha-L-rhamnosidase C-terminal domain-containing protein [uncultured Alistipes sp.]|uniref:alpha-L-rhamnosidase-related protein n=1 Tax=uncultured Alistipes sp. TaxID=538949 RepID=UPI0025DDFDCE|nr:alpha-L-rhamnosidase C-terminal domain-containing protein [uncultured Alistipes sp.]
MNLRTFLTTACLIITLPLSAQQHDSRVREYIAPARIVWLQHGEQIAGIENLLLPGNGQSELANRPLCVLRSQQEKRPAFLVDFGKQLQGGLQLVTGMSPSHTPVKIRVRLGESVGEAMSENGERGAANDHAMRDFEVSLPWLGVLEIGNSGFRFARIDLVDEDAELHLKEVRAISVYRGIPYLGSFCSSDERLDRIWRTGAYTVHLNMQEYLWDGVKRDRLVWVGDLHPEVMTVSSVFGYNEVVPKSLDLVRDITPPTEWMNGISSYSLWWIMIHWDWYLYQGDLDYLKQQQPYFSALMRHLLTKFDATGKEQLDGIRFLDWPSSENPKAIDAGLQALMISTLDAAQNICSALGDEQLRRECEAMRLRALAKKARDRVLDPFLRSGKAPDAPGSKQAASLMSLAGVMDAGRADKEYLSVNGSNGFSTFYGYYMLRAMAAAGNYGGAMDVIRQYWGAMLDLGATTFWEDFDLKWIPGAARIDELVPEGKKDIHGDFGAYCYEGFRHSLCHGWASGPTAWLSEYVLGIQVVEPGCKTVRISPRMGDLQWVEGTFPTPYGVIKVRHEKGADGAVVSTIDAPEEIKIIR